MLDAASWRAGLPGLIEAVFAPASSAGTAFETRAREVHRRLLANYDLTPSSVPFLQLNLTDAYRPFSAWKD